MKHLLTTTALALVLSVSPAAAQDQKPADQQQMAPQQPTSPTMPEAKSDAPQKQEKSDAAQKQDMDKADKQAGKTDVKKSAQAGAGALQFVEEQQTDEGLASDLIGATVTNAKDESIGDINDLLYDDSGKITAAVIGVGGFLGIGEKNVAIKFESLQISKGESDKLKVTLNTTKESLESAPKFVSLDEK